MDQAQFRELEAFAKFGSDLDAATKQTIHRGRLNQEVLKQGQYSPVSVENQVAVIFASTKGFIDSLTEEQVKPFEAEYINALESSHKDVLDAVSKGVFDDNVTSTLEKVAKEVVSKIA